MDSNITFQDLKIWDIFQTETEDYYIKIKPTNGFNSILLTGKEIDCFNFDDVTKVIKLIR